MTDQPGPDPAHAPQSPAGNSGPTYGNSSISSGRDTHITESIIATGPVNQTINKIKKTAGTHPVAAAMALALMVGGTVYGGYTVTTSLAAAEAPRVDVGVVNRAGADGAKQTVQQIRNAERAGDAKPWCHIVAPSDKKCVETMAGKFSAQSQAYRNQVDKVGIGGVTTTGSEAQVMLTWEGTDQGTVPLTWTGGRWQMDSGNYALMQMAGGVFLSLVAARNGELQLNGIRIPT